MAKPTLTTEDRLVAFCGVVDDALSRRAITEGTITSSLHFSATADEWDLDTDSGDTDDVRSLMVDIRRLIMDGEPTQFFKIAKLLYVKLTDDHLRDASVTNRDQWARALGQASVTVHDNGKDYIPSEMFKLVAYGGMFHTDPTLIEEWNALDDASRRIIETGVSELLIRCVKIARMQRNLIRKAIDEALINLT